MESHGWISRTDGLGGIGLDMLDCIRRFRTHGCMDGDDHCPFSYCHVNIRIKDDYFKCVFVDVKYSEVMFSLIDIPAPQRLLSFFSAVS